MLRSILFDLDRTLLDRDASIGAFASSQFEVFRSRLDGVDRDAYVSAFVRLDARGSVWKDEVYQRLTSELKIHSVPWEELFADFDARVADYYVPFPNLHDTLGELARDYRLGLITNGRTHFQTRTINTLKIAPFFTVVLISETEGVRKPDAEIFHRALRRMGIAPHEAAYVGDHPISDMKGARDAGMLSFWKRNADFSEVACDGSFGDLSELPAIVRQLRQADAGDRRPSGDATRPSPLWE